MKNTFFLLFFIAFRFFSVAQETIYNPFQPQLPPLEFDGQYSFDLHSLQEIDQNKFLFAISYHLSLSDSTIFYPLVDSAQFKICIADENFSIEKSVNIKFLQGEQRHFRVKMIAEDGYIYVVMSRYQPNGTAMQVFGYDIIKYDYNLNKLAENFVTITPHAHIYSGYAYNLIINEEKNLVLADYYKNIPKVSLIELDSNLMVLKNNQTEIPSWDYIRAFFQANDGHYYIVYDSHIYKFNSDFELIRDVNYGHLNNPYSVSGQHVKIGEDVYLGGTYNTVVYFPPNDFLSEDRLSLYKFNPGDYPGYELLGSGGKFEFYVLEDVQIPFAGLYEDHLFFMMYYSETYSPSDVKGRLASFRSNGELNWELFLEDDGYTVHPLDVVATLDTGVIIQVLRTQGGAVGYGPSELAKFDKDGNLVQITDVTNMLLPEKERIRLSPNPFVDRIELIGDRWTEAPTTLTLYDIKGAVVRSLRVTQAAIDLPDLRDGMYFYVIRQQNGIIGNGKLVKTGGK